MGIEIKLDPSLLEGKRLQQVYYLPHREIKWYLLSEEPATRNIDEFAVLAEQEVLERFPEVRELLTQEPDREVMLWRGRTSGRWIDFV